MDMGHDESEEEPNGLILVDQKRRRIDSEDTPCKPNNSVLEMANAIITQKNVPRAGPVDQARLEQ